MVGRVLTEEQIQLIRKRAEDISAWRNETDLERRRRVAGELQGITQKSGAVTGGIIDHRTLCELVGLQWQIQNLNPMQMPQFLGLYAYKVHFSDFQGTEDDLHALRKEETGDEGFYPGADLAVVSEALRLIASDSSEDQGRGASQLLSLPGVGQALVSGFLHLLHPNKYGLVNSPTKSPFSKSGWLQVTENQRNEARKVAKGLFANSAQLSNQIFHFVFRWQVFLAEVRDACGFQDFHEVDQFLWKQVAPPQPDLELTLKGIVDQIEEPGVAVRTDAESKARKLIQENLGHLNADQFSSLFTHINTCLGKNGVVYTRCAPAFVGHNANQLIEQAPKLNTWIEKLWKAPEEDITQLLNQFWSEKVAGGGRSFPTTILYLRDGEKYAIWTPALEKALSSFSGGMPAKIQSGFSYLQYCRRVQELRKRFGFPPEMHDWVLFRMITKAPSSTAPKGDFKGFTSDTFKFMEDLASNNSQEWFDANRQRFKDSVDKPLRALVKDLGEQVITQLDPKLETSPQSGKCVSRIRKNIYGKQSENAYQELYWAAFYRKDRTKGTDCQLILTVHPNLFSYGFFFGEQADDVRQHLSEAMAQHPELGKAIFSSLQEAGFLFAIDENHTEPIDVPEYPAFVDLAKKHRVRVYRRLPPAETVARGEGLRDEIGDDFRKLYPLFVLATSSDPTRDLKKLIDPPGMEEQEEISIADLAAATFMDETFFHTLELYLQDKKQLIFCGPPGTGKTYVALKYAEYLTRDGGEVRTVQFHPSYGYEDFIEGIRPTVEYGVLAYEVEDGIFKRLCDEARADPNGQYVLLIDEINRGNIPKIFGELLFLLERREHKTDLPYSKEPFSIPLNVIILGTMNSSDRSIALMDLALRRRFHFVEMQPRSEVLAGWLKAYGKPECIRHVFDKLNDTLLKCGIEQDRLIGHAHFMSAQLDGDFLELIWTGTIEPLLKEYFFAEPEKLAEFSFDKFQVLIEDEQLAEEDDLEEDEDVAEVATTEVEASDQ